MRQVDNLYEYIAVYIDDLCISSKDPKAITDTLTEQYGFKLKGTGPIDSIDYHLGMTFCQNDRNDLCISPQHYIEKMVESYKQMFNEDGIQQYQSLIGSMQWAISIGHFNIAVHVMSMSSFRTLIKPNTWLGISPSFNLPRYEYLPMSLIIQMLRGLNMIGPSLSMVTYQRLSQGYLPLLLEASSHHCMDSELLGYICTSDFPNVSGRWVLNPVWLSQTFGCIRLTIFMSTLLST
jgi:hypothetical protein